MGSTYLKSDAFNQFQQSLDELYELFDKMSFKINKQELSEAFKDLFANLSTQITNRSRKLYARLSDTETLEKNKHFIHFVEYSNQLSYLVCQSILQQNKRSKRVLCFEIWAYTLNECVLNGDYTGATSIYTGLNSYFMHKYVNRYQTSSGCQYILDLFDKLFKQLLMPSHTYNLQKKYLAKATIDKSLIIPQLSGIMGSIETGKQVFNDNQNELNRLLKQKILVENKLRKCLKKLKHQKPSKKPINESSINTLNQLATDINLLKSKYELILNAFDGIIPTDLSQTKGINKILNFLEACRELNQNQLGQELIEQAHERSSTGFHIYELLDECREIENLDMIDDFAQEHCSKAKNKTISKQVTKYIKIGQVFSPSTKVIHSPEISPSTSDSNVNLVSQISKYFTKVDELYATCADTIETLNNGKKELSLSSISIFKYAIENKSSSDSSSNCSEDNKALIHHSNDMYV